MPTNCNPESNEFCTPPEGTSTLLTVELQGGLAINLLGIHVDVCPLCVAVYFEGTGTGSQQTEIANGLLQIVRGLIPNIPSV